MGETTELAYLAGVVDSDGWISVARGKHRSGAPRWYPRVGICGTRTESHALAVAVFGGAIRSYVNRSTEYRPMFEWTRSGVEAVRVIDALRPFLLVKREQAEIALTVAMVASQQAELCADFSEQLDGLHHDVRTLNQWRRAHAR